MIKALFDTIFGLNYTIFAKQRLSVLQGFLLVFSVTSKKSFQQVQAIKKEIEKSRGKDVG